MLVCICIIDAHLYGLQCRWLAKPLFIYARCIRYIYVERGRFFLASTVSFYSSCKSSREQLPSRYFHVEQEKERERKLFRSRARSRAPVYCDAKDSARRRSSIDGNKLARLIIAGERVCVYVHEHRRWKSNNLIFFPSRNIAQNECLPRAHWVTSKVCLSGEEKKIMFDYWIMLSELCTRFETDCCSAIFFYTSSKYCLSSAAPRARAGMHL